MTEADAREYVAQHDKDWEMPDTWWQIETAEMSFHVSEETAATATEELELRNVGEHSRLYDFVDIYGAACSVRWAAITAIFESTPLGRAKWIAGLSKRNYQADEPPEQQEWEKP